MDSVESMAGPVAARSSMLRSGRRWSRPFCAQWESIGWRLLRVILSVPTSRWNGCSRRPCDGHREGAGLSVCVNQAAPAAGRPAVVPSVLHAPILSIPALARRQRWAFSPGYRPTDAQFERTGIDYAAMVPQMYRTISRVRAAHLGRRPIADTATAHRARIRATTSSIR